MLEQIWAAYLTMAILCLLIMMFALFLLFKLDKIVKVDNEQQDLLAQPEGDRRSESDET